MTRFKGATSIADKDVQYKIYEAHKECDVKDFLKEYKEWMQKGHSIDGLDKFTYLSYANGTTEVFDKFYLRRRNSNTLYIKNCRLYFNIALFSV